MSRIRDAIAADNYAEFAREFRARYSSRQH